jgi:hypothetical protein
VKDEDFSFRESSMKSRVTTFVALLITGAIPAPALFAEIPKPDDAPLPLSP